MLLLCLAGQLHTGDTLEAVRFEGMRTFSSRALSQLVTVRVRRPSSENQLNNDAAALESFYQDEGFHSVRVEKQMTRGRRLPVVTFHITEGPRTRVSAIALTGNSTVGTEQLLKQLTVRPGRFFSQTALDQSVAALRTYYLNSGYPFAQVQDTVTRTDTLATISFSITEGRLCHVSEVRVRGNRTVRTRTVLRASEIRPGEQFSQKRMQEAQRRLYATKLFYRVMFFVIADSGQETRTRDQGGPDSVAVRFDVVEQAYRGVSLGAGVEIPPRLLVSAEWEHDNLFNRGHTLVVGGEFSPTLPWSYRVGFDGTYRVPYLILTRIDFQTHPYFSYERLNDLIRQREYGIETGMTRSLVPQFTVGLTNRLLLHSDTLSGITNSLALSGQYDTRDDIFDPAQGLSVHVVVEGAGGPLWGDNDFYRLTGDVRWYQRLGIRVRGQGAGSGDFVLAMRGMAGSVRPYGRTVAVPYYEAFTLGGRSTLRGYPDRSIGPGSSPGDEYRYGTAVVNGNVELRTPYILRWVGLVGFFDVGDVGYDFRMRVYEYGAGAGIRVRTPIGPVRLDWGKRLRNPPSGDKGRFYLGLLHAF
ncbi:MAG: BamA/TamA family outer membrane protein [candidate division WOR-3 bacterium]|nr:BamA/TamA family outer membrane protein [candidate division WOR-3 bacterium]